MRGFATQKIRHNGVTAYESTPYDLGGTRSKAALPEGMLGARGEPVPAPAFVEGEKMEPFRKWMPSVSPSAIASETNRCESCAFDPCSRSPCCSNDNLGVTHLSRLTPDGQMRALGKILNYNL